MDKGKYTVFKRRFLVEGLPPGHSPSEPHLQIFDNFPKGSELRLRKIRNPETREWEFFLEKDIQANEDPRKRQFEQIILSETEYTLFEGFRGRETRKNRYHLGKIVPGYFIDIYLGKLWGLNIATFWSEEESTIDLIQKPELAVREITGEEFFEGKTITDLEFEDIREYLTQKKGGEGASSV